MQSLITAAQDQVTVWDNQKSIDEVKKICGPTLTDQEFAIFMNIGKATNLNPFLREIWAVKYDAKSAASIFIGRDGYRKVAQSNPDYDYHVVDSVYEKDSFSREDDAVKHAYSLTDRGALVGAYCTVKRKKSSKPCFVFVKLNEYSTGKALWATKPETMIKKVAEAQGLRMAFQSLFAGTYDESENWKEKTTVIEPKTGEFIDYKAQELLTVDQLKATWDVFAKSRYGASTTESESQNYLRIALNTHFNKASLEELSQDEAQRFISKCNLN